MVDLLNRISQLQARIVIKDGFETKRKYLG